jgi:hypothetical protein
MRNLRRQGAFGSSAVEKVTSASFEARSDCASISRRPAKHSHKVLLEAPMGMSRDLCDWDREVLEHLAT